MASFLIYIFHILFELGLKKSERDEVSLQTKKTRFLVKLPIPRSRSKMVMCVAWGDRTSSGFQVSPA
jgi:hypothetical protein